MCVSPQSLDLNPVELTCVSVHEGIFLFKNGVDPYSGGVFYQVRSTTLVPNQLFSQPPCSLSFVITVSSLPVVVLNPPSAEPGLKPLTLDISRCRWRLCPRADVESEEWRWQDQKRRATRRFVRRKYRRRR